MTDFQIGDTKILVGNCLERMKDIPTGTVNTCVTSPPYFGLRDYGTAVWEGGLYLDCDHLESRGGRSSVKQDWIESLKQYEYQCGKCSAIRVDQQIGMEDTPEDFVRAMVAVFREVRRCLRDDGTVWLNLGDSFASDSKGSDSKGSGGPSEKQDSNGGSRYEVRKFNHGMKNKDLVGIPWAVAFALRADGWYLRSDIVWHKPNPMPESVTDRPTKSHEYIFLLSKSPQYYYDSKAIAETTNGFKAGGKNNGLDNPKVPNPKKKQDALGKGTYTGFNDRWKEKPVQDRNKRDVWSVATEPYSEAHFATFPMKLIEPCILAGCPPRWIGSRPFYGKRNYGRCRQSERTASDRVRTQPRVRRTYQEASWNGWICDD